MRQLRNVYAVFLITILCACTQLGINSPTTFNENLAIAYGTVTQVRSTATSLLKAGKISSDDAQNVNNQADNARAAADIARQVSATDLTAANAKLNAVHVVLTALQDYLNTRSK